MGPSVRTARREKPSKFLVSPAARSAASLTSSSRSRDALLSPGRLISMATLHRMAVSKLLKSCATPPASLPSASIFCVAQLLFEATPIGDVLGGTDEPIRLSIGIVDQDGPVRNPANRSIGSDDAVLDEVLPVDRT